MSQVPAQPDALIGDLAPAPALWRNLSFHLLWTSTFAAGLADRLILNASWSMLGIDVKGTDASSIQAGVDFFFFLPYVLWSPLAGWLVDRLPRKWVMFAADELRGVVVLCAFLIIPAGLVNVPADHHWKVYTVITLVGMMAATFVAAKLSIVPNIVGFANLQRANSMVVSMGVIGNLLGFAAAAAIAKALDGPVRWMVIVSALSYIISGMFWIFIRTPWQSPPSAAHGELEAGGSPLAMFRQIWDGARYAWQHRPLRILIGTAALVWGGTSIFLPALGAINKEHFGGEEYTLHILLFMVGLGMLAGSVIMAIVNPRRGGELLMVAGLIGCGLFIGLQMVTLHYYAAMVVATLVGVCSTVLLIPLYSTLQRITADHIRGRVIAAKEILTELPKVALSYAVWVTPKTDQWMQLAGGVLSALLLAAAVYGIVKYVIVGPTHSRYLNVMWRLSRLVSDAVHRVRIVGRHRIPSRGPGLLVCNHTNGVDPMLVQSGILRVTRWMMAREYQIGLLGRLWRRMRPISVDRASRDSAALREAIRALNDDGDLVGIFPEGGIHDDPATLGRFVPGVAVIAGKTDAPIIPVFITGTPRGGSPFMSYLRPSHAVVIIGPPFRLDPAMDRKDRADEIRRRVEALRPTV